MKTFFEFLIFARYAVGAQFSGLPDRRIPKTRRVRPGRKPGARDDVSERTAMFMPCPRTDPQSYEGRRSRTCGLRRSASERPRLGRDFLQRDAAFVFGGQRIDHHRAIAQIDLVALDTADRVDTPVLVVAG